jgi:hypothetical protein
MFDVRASSNTSFPAAVEALGPPLSPDEALSDLSVAFCRVIVVNRGLFPVPLVHTVTPISALRTLMPYVSEYGPIGSTLCSGTSVEQS